MRKLAFFFLIILISGCLRTNTEESAPIREITQNIQTKTNGNMTVSFIDVGQGDSILISQAGNNMLIDCGDKSHGDDVLKFIDSNGVDSLDILVITHTDFDHLGGCAEIIRNTEIKTIILDGQKRDTASYKELIEIITEEQGVIAKEGYKGSLGDVLWEVIHANQNSTDPNQNSIVIRMDYGKVSFLFTGDCDLDCEKSLIGKNIDIDVLKVGHHCSKYGTKKEFLEEVTPAVAVIEVGDGNRYGHPAEECLDNLDLFGAKVYRTDLHGDIIISTDGDLYSITG